MYADGDQQPAGNYALINGLDLYCEIHGRRQALAVLPAATHVGWAPPHHGIMTRSHLLVPIIEEFLDG